MDEAGSTDGEQAPADDDAVIETPATAETPEEQLTRLEAERAQLQALLEHEADANRRILEAHGIAEGRLAELEGVLTGTEAVRARAEAERDELERRLTIELAAREQQHGEIIGAAEHRAQALAELLERHVAEAEAQAAEGERGREQDAARIAELEQRLAEELAQAASHAESLNAELKQAREDVRPRAARKLAEVQAALDAERSARAELELQVAALTESERALEQARAQESKAAEARIAELEPALEEARTGWQSTWRELDSVNERLAVSQARLQEVEGERDAGAERVSELVRSLGEAEDGIEVLERALDSVSADRDRIETARRVLEARLSTRDEAERAAIAERELERRTARAQRLQLTRVERRMTEIASGLGIAMRRLEGPVLPQASRRPAQEPEPAARAQQPAPASGGAAVAEAERPQPDTAPEETAPQAPQRTLSSGFLASAGRFPERPALEVGGVTLAYAALQGRAAQIAATLQRHAPAADPPLTGVFAHRSASAFAGLLGAMMRGHGYVPLNRTLPVARTRTMLERAGCQAIVVDAESAEQLPDLLGPIKGPIVVLAPEAQPADVEELRRALPAHHVLGEADLEPAEAWRPVEVDPSAIAYLLFTSGSTGVPKGVMVAHRNALHYVDVLVARYAISEQDRFSQSHDLTFDNSVFDLFVAWERGACVCCPGQRTLLNPGRYIRDSRLTVWFSVPSIAMFMRRLGGLKPNSCPELRWSLFAGEPLPLEVARAWEKAAPNSTVENLYGPTETTVDVTLYRWNAETSPPECERGILPIGHPLPNIGVLIADEELCEVAPGEQGELLVSGPQVSLGYWRDPERTAEAFVTPPGHDAVHYRTGDLVRRPQQDGPIVFLGRRDSQVKVRGVRIELGEIESALRDASGVDAVAALGWPTTLVGADGVEAFVGSDEVDVGAVRAALAERLPGHMVPRRVRGLPELPLNANGKIDRKALIRLLEAE